MSNSFSIEISGSLNLSTGEINDSSSVDQDFEVCTPESYEPAQRNQWSQRQASDHGEEVEALSKFVVPASGSVSSNKVTESQQFRVGPPEQPASTQDLRLSTLNLDFRRLTDQPPSDKEDALLATPHSVEGPPLAGFEREVAPPLYSQQQQEQTPPRRGWDHQMFSPHSPRSPRQSDSPRGVSRERPRSSSPSAARSSFRGPPAPQVASRRRSSAGYPYEGIHQQRRTEGRWADHITTREDGAIGSRIRLWVAPGSVFWRFLLSALIVRIGSALALLVVVLTTLERMGRAVTCEDMSNCLEKGGLLAFPRLLKTQPNFSTGIMAYQSITGSLMAGLVLVLLPMTSNCYYTYRALRKGTRETYLREVKATTCCTAWVGACIGAFIPPAFFTHQFCNLGSFDVNAADRADGSAIEAVSSNMCSQAVLVWACVGTALLCALSAGLLLFQRYSRLWATVLGLGCFKFMFAGFILCFTIMFSLQSNDMMLETAEDVAKQLIGLEEPMVAQLSLFFASLTWGGSILASTNLACGAFTIWSAYLRSHLLSCTNMVVNFVFFFINAVSFCAMLFEYATLRMACNYTLYPMPQSYRARAEAALFCSIKPQFLFVWLLVALLTLMNFIEFFVSAALFQQHFYRSKGRKPGVPLSAPSIDSLPPKWGARR